MEKRSQETPPVGAVQPETEVVKGISESHIDELIRLSATDPEILKRTPKDAKQRFADRESFERWRSQDRAVYTLVDGEELAGIIWLGPRACDVETVTASHTFAIRLYGDYRGKGLAREFMDSAVTDFVQSHPEVTGVWLDTDIDNEAALSLYQHCGFVENSRTEERITMVLEV